MRRFICFLFGLTLLSFIFLAGCSNKVKLGGKVTFADDGSPLTVGTVCFEQNGFAALGDLNSEGWYQLGSTSLGDGLPPGKYIVYINGAMESTGKNKLGMEGRVPILDPKYTDPTKPVYTVEVDRSKKRFDFTVERIKK